MWVSGVLLLICHYQMVSASKTIMTNEISMPSLGHKEGSAIFRRLQPINEGVPGRYRSSRFERLRGAPEDIKPVFVKPAIIETETPLFNGSPAGPIQVIPSSETVTEQPIDPPSQSTDSLTETSPSFNQVTMESSSIYNQIFTQPSEEPTTETFTETTTEPPTEPTQVSRKAFPILVETSREPAHTIQEYAQERVYPTAGKHDIEFVQVHPSEQVEVASTNVVQVEEADSTTTKAPKKRRHRRKHRKHRKLTKPTETPTEVTTPLEQTTKPSTIASTTTTLPITTPVATTTSTSATPTKPPVITTAFITAAPIPAVLPTFPAFGTAGGKTGESYLGGWNEDEGVIVTTSGPSLGTAINQFSELPASIAIDDDEAVKKYYEKYYAEWYQKHNQATGTPETSVSAAPHQIKIELGKKPTTTSSIAASSGISSSTAKPTKEQLDKVCNYVARISKSFGIKDLVGFAKNNCAFVKSFHPVATCEQIQHLMEYCVTGVLVDN